MGSLAGKVDAGTLSVGHSEIGCTSTRPIDNQKLLLHEKAVGDNSLCATRPQESGNSGQQM
ncbi:MAG: hypothetical protein GY792_00740 [Gammaproteobacteria bacterium]|nr:hypothetical protein [Gammaproteobacteria bacterium]